MNPGRFYVPPYIGMGNNMISNGIRATGPMIRMANNTSRGMGFFSKITNSIRSVNWGGLLNNANKTLNVVNQTIPLVRQAGPMVNNMKSMLRIAKAFGNETNSNRFNYKYNGQALNSNNRNNNGNNNNDNSNLNTVDIENSYNLTKKEDIINDNSPNFFV